MREHTMLLAGEAFNLQPKHLGRYDITLYYTATIYLKISICMFSCDRYIMDVSF